MKNVKRRNFLSGIGGGFAGTLALNRFFKYGKAHAATAGDNSVYSGPLTDVKLNIKLVYSALIHEAKWEGPCRARAGVSGDEERQAHKASFARWCEGLQKDISGTNAHFLKPEMLEYIHAYKTFKRFPKELNKLDADAEDVDLYIVSMGTIAQVLGIEIGKRFKKPVLLIGGTGISCGRSRDCCAYLRDRGFEAYGPASMDELNRLITELRARKILRQTHILIIADEPLPPLSNMATACDFDDLERRFGIRTTIIPNHVLEEEMERALKDNNELEKARKLADRLMRNAQWIHIDKKYVSRDTLFYYVIKNLMNRFDCNAFTIECWEFCTTMLPFKWKINPCLTHSLLKDEGYTSACQGDISALLSMRMLSTLSNSAPFMGNQDYTEFDGLIQVGHSVPTLKMNGFDTPDQPYGLKNFTESGFGTKFVIDFSKNHKKTVTMARVNPSVTKLMIAKGEIEKCTGLDTISCSFLAHIRVTDAFRFMRIQNDFGLHVAMTYGDYIQPFTELGEILGLDVVDAS